MRASTRTTRRASALRTFALAGLIACGGGGAVSAQVHDSKIYTFVLFDQLEFGTGHADPISWDVEGWVGGDFTKLWFKTEGTQLTRRGEGDAEVQALFSRLITPFWDLQVGLRLDAQYGGEVDRMRGLVAVGVEGLAPYWFDVEASVFVSHEGDISLRATSTYDLLVTQRLIAQPRFELNAAVQEVPEFGVGSGLNDLELGWRLRYEFRRKFAPYVGISWTRRIGGSAAFARDEGAEVSDFSWVGGLRIWF